jgi:aldose 1-epimerase
VIELTVGDEMAVIDVARGGRLASLRVGGEELIVGPSDAADDSIRWGCYLMAPWPGRLADGRLEWRGRTVQLERTHGRHAIHGLVARVPWRIDRADAVSADLSVSLDRGGWPFGGLVRQRFRLAPGRLELDAEIVAERSMPAALGWHPWFLRRDDPALRVDGDQVLESSRMIPTGRLLPAKGRFDLRACPRLGRRRLDDVYVGVRPPLEITWPDLTLRLETEPWLSTVVVYTPPEAVCVEPESALPNMGQGARTLEAGQAMRASLVLAWAPRG